MSEVHLFPLSELVLPPISGSRPAGGVSADAEGIPSIGGENILADGGMTYVEQKKIPTAFFQLMPKGKLQRDDVLINKDGAQTGKVGIYLAPFENAAINEHVFILRARDRRALDQHYLYYCLLLSDTQIQIQRRITGSAQPGLNSQFVRAVKIPVPLPAQQKKITAILGCIDDAIECTEALIAKYRQIKAGLMRDLFTRGVLPNGQLRPSRELAPEMYRETGIGWIPKAWDVEALESLLAPVPNNIRSGPFGSALLKHELVEDGIPFLGIDNIHVERFDSDFRRFVSERKFHALSKYRVRPGDVVITIMGTVGRCCVVPEDIDRALSSKHLWTLTLDRTKVLPELICWQLNHSSWALSCFRRSMRGGIMDAIQSSTLKTLRLPLPGIDEQVMIRDLYLQSMSQIDGNAKQLEKLRLQKLGLMQDLLTGRVPVRVGDAQTEAA